MHRGPLGSHPPVRVSASQYNLTHPAHLLTHFKRVCVSLTHLRVPCIKHSHTHTRGL